MKVHYTNILLSYAINLSILLISSHINIQKNHYINALHTPNTTKMPTTRLLCECDLYTSIYDNYPEMKDVMQQYDRQISQRFEEYNEHMQEKRQKCKEQCEKDIQKIILKDKIEKELTETLETLETNIKNEDIPTCVCEKSVADKVEKTCLKCGGILGTAVPELGLIGGITFYAINKWSITATAEAIKFAQQAGAAAGKAAGEAAGIAKTIAELDNHFFLTILNRKSMQDVITAKNFWDPAFISEAVKSESTNVCFITPYRQSHEMFCSLANSGGTADFFERYIVANAQTVVSKSSNAAAQATNATTQQVTTALIESNKNAIEATCVSYHTAIIASIVAILIIVLIMFVIYLILRYRRTKKMKKKLQYIKLLKE
ncbi:rifin [Plasmodium sp. gorilla clade G1]|nr:rifin [Plasmodium sp. gorilla clade G1]